MNDTATVDRRFCGGMMLKVIAQRLCDASRRRNPPLRFFIGDPPCALCLGRARKIRERLRKADKLR